MLIFFLFLRTGIFPVLLVTVFIFRLGAISVEKRNKFKIRQKKNSLQKFEKAAEQTSIVSVR